MSKERELLERWIEGGLLNDSVYVPLLKETQKLLAEPETKQEPVAWRWKKTSGWAYQDNNNNGGEPLYLSPPTRKPLSDDEVFSLYENSEYLGFLAYRKGIKDAEKSHSITGGGND